MQKLSKYYFLSLSSANPLSDIFKYILFQLHTMAEDMAGPSTIQHPTTENNQFQKHLSENVTQSRWLENMEDGA